MKQKQIDKLNETLIESGDQISGSINLLNRDLVGTLEKNNKTFRHSIQRLNGYIERILHELERYRTQEQKIGEKVQKLKMQETCKHENKGVNQTENKQVIFCLECGKILTGYKINFVNEKHGNKM